jgi:alkylation response protein AidB-like acyl-CoA dehydrogenase
VERKDNFYTDNPDLQFHLERKVDFEFLFSLISPSDRDALGVSNAKEYLELWRDTAFQVGKVSGEIIAENQKKVATSDLKLEKGEVVYPKELIQNMDVLKSIGLASLGIDAEHGGIPSPLVGELPAVEIIYRACPSTFLNVTWYAPIARVISEFASEEQKSRVLPRIASGEWSGSMALTEPDAGSDLGAIRTFAELQSDGKYRLFGAKRFISNGCGMVSLVLAQSERGQRGLASLSLFLCLRKSPDGKNNFEVTKLEEKTGLHGSPTCELQFEGSSAELIGDVGKGFQYMLHLMNEARVGVAIQGVGIMESVLRLAKKYTSERKTWGRPIAQHELICEKLLDMEVSTAAVRSLCYEATTAISITLLVSKRIKNDKSLSKEQLSELLDLKRKYNRRARRWTPLVKYFSGEQVVKNARECLQMHGGYGFTCEYQPEWWLRESLIIPLYEGTSQIQALMCIKDSLKEIIKRPKSFIESALGSTVQVISERDPLKRKLNRLRQIYNSSLMSIIFKLVKTNMKASFSDVNPSDVRQVLQILTKELMKFENMRPALMNAERVTELKVMVCAGEALLRDAKIDPSRTWIAERWLNKSIPRAVMLQTEIDIEEPVFARKIAEYPPMTLNQ